MVNVEKLKDKIKEKGFSINKLSAQMGTNKSTFYRKIGEKGNFFSIREANLIVDLLGLSSYEAVSIFFAQVVA